MLEHRSRQAGQAAAEYLGALLLVSVVVAALVTSGLGGQIAGGISDLVCRIGGGECESGQAGRPGGADRAADLERRQEAVAGLGGEGAGYQELLDQAEAARQAGDLDEAERLVKQLELYKFLTAQDRGDLVTSLDGPSSQAFDDLVGQGTIEEDGDRNRRYFTVPPSPGDGVIAMDFFIPSGSSGIFLSGDKRDTVDPLLGAADLDDSRVILVADRESGRGVITQSKTCGNPTLFGSGACRRPRLIELRDPEQAPQGFNAPNEFDVRGSDGALELRYDALNSIIPGGLSIDGSVRFERGPNGRYRKTADTRDPYPRIVTGQYRPGQPGGIIDETDDTNVVAGAPPKPVRDAMKGVAKISKFACTLPVAPIAVPRSSLC